MSKEIGKWMASDTEKARGQTAMCVTFQDYILALSVLQDLQVNNLVHIIYSFSPEFMNEVMIKKDYFEELPLTFLRTQKK